ncbi:MAG: SCO family protein [Geminicoccaceae bacterium]
MDRRTLALLAAKVVAVLVIGAALWLWLSPFGREQTPSAAVTGTVPIGGAFSLVDQDGKRITEQDFRGRWMLVYFGYTFCPDACPLSLTHMAEALDLLPPATADKVVPVLITVDPERDTVAVLKDYVGAFSPRLVGLTGTPAEVQPVLKAWKVYARKAEPAADGSYLMDHSTFIYLMAPDGAYAAHFGHDATPEQIAGQIKALVEG